MHIYAHTYTHVSNSIYTKDNYIIYYVIIDVHIHTYIHAYTYIHASYSSYIKDRLLYNCYN